MTLWTAAEAAAATAGIVRGAWACHGVSIDTRSLRAGDLFVALRAVRDGHDYVAEAFAKGAAAALVSHVPRGVAKSAPLLLVEDVQDALRALGKAARARSKARVVAITGSAGKTSTKEMLYRILSRQGRAHASYASYNNHWGVPLSLARMPKDTEFAVFELGMNRPGEISPLARLVRPHVALITTVGAAHLQAFADIAAIAREKAAIFDGLDSAGVAVVNADIATADVLTKRARQQGARVCLFGTCADPAGWVLQDVVQTGFGYRAKVRAGGVPTTVLIASSGRHFVMNGVAALAAATALGADRAKAVRDLQQWAPQAGRGARQTIQLDPRTPEAVLDLIDDSYNANPASVAAGLAMLAAASPRREGHRIAFLGDMKELGAQEHRLHRQLAELGAMQAVDVVHTVGPCMRHLHDALPAHRRGQWCETSQQMAASACRLVNAGDCVLIKGSLSVNMACVVQALHLMGASPRPLGKWPSRKGEA